METRLATSLCPERLVDSETNSTKNLDDDVDLIASPAPHRSSYLFIRRPIARRLRPSRLCKTGATSPPTRPRKLRIIRPTSPVRTRPSPLLFFLFFATLSPLTLAQLIFEPNPELTVFPQAITPQPNGYTRGPSRCYDDQGRPQRCVPPFVNAAFNQRVDATNTCGIPAIEFCRQTGHQTGATRSCDICDATDPNRAHPPRYLTDFNNDSNMTYWQSETMLQGIQFPNSVNLTLHLGKSFDITYVRLKFYSSRPESFAIYKKACDSCRFEPYQFYSSSCEETYGRPRRGVVTRLDERLAICTDEFSDISPLTGGNVAFSTLEGRPSAYNFDQSPELQDFVTAVSIRITLDRINSFGDEVFGDPKVLKSYYYAISDFAVGARCKCNGHASECVNSTGQGLSPKLVCRCEHHTTGPDCGECLPFYNDQPWQKATGIDANECKACNCNNLATRCFFDQELWRKTGSGGHCLDCQRNTTGPHCDQCKENYYRQPENNDCIHCRCNDLGSESGQCDAIGRCRCKPGVGGVKCDRCLPNFYDFSSFGCRPCACVEAGSLNNNPTCETNTGVCRCKEHAEGQNCDTCKPGFFNLDSENEFGCMACFCYGQSSQCRASHGFSPYQIFSAFKTDSEGWTVETKDRRSSLPLTFNPLLENVQTRSANESESLYFSAPSSYLGDQRFSYNKQFRFKLRVTGDAARASREDVVVEGNGMRVSAPIFAQGNRLPDDREDREFAFRLHEHPAFQWSPRVDTLAFQKILANLTAIRLRASFAPNGAAVLDDVSLESARRSNDPDNAAPWVEECTCPAGYVGQFCESCEPGYRRDPPGGGPLARCIPCNCNGHSTTCDVDTGRCICRHNTEGANCERCANGFYGYALKGTSDDCRPCPCPKQGPCVELLDGDVICTACPSGYAGHHCEMCADGFYGDPRNNIPCRACQCNGNIDRNAVGNCNRTTGRCLKCIYNTRGFNCQECKEGHYGNPLSPNQNDKCKACDCFVAGTVSEPDTIPQCDISTGQCPCQPHVMGKKCDVCQEGYWNISSERGCERCGCDFTGSHNRSCAIDDGQCHCRAGVANRRCDECLPHHYGFSEEGCGACSCHPEGSTSLQCDETGQCPCRPNVEGLFCDRCRENMFDLSAGCMPCPACYGLVQRRVAQHRKSMAALHVLLKQASGENFSLNDTEFESLLHDVQSRVENLHEVAEEILDADGPSDNDVARLRQLKDDVADLVAQTEAINLADAEADGHRNVSLDRITDAVLLVDSINELLENLTILMDSDGKETLEMAEQELSKYSEESEEMMKMTKEARALATRISDEADTIVGNAESARNKSNLAHDLFQEAYSSGERVSADLDRLREDIRSLDADLADSAADAEEQFRRCEKTLSDAQRLKQAATEATVPYVDKELVLQKAASVAEDAAKVEEVAGRQIEQQQEMLSIVSKAVAEGEELLEETQNEQRRLDELMADADRHKQTASAAATAAKDIVDEAEQTLETLRNFDREVENNKDDADAAVGLFPEIERIVDEAAVVTDRVVEGGEMSAAEANATAAAEALEEARRLASEAGNDTEALEELARKAEAAAVEAEELLQRVGANETALEELENSTIGFAEKAEEALRVAEEAGSTEEDGRRKAEGVMRMLERLLKEIEGLDVEVNQTVLRKVSKKLDEAEKGIEDAGLAATLAQIQAGAKQQEAWILEYSNVAEELEKEVRNIEDIHRALPRDCQNSNRQIESESETLRQRARRGRRRRKNKVQ